MEPECKMSDTIIEALRTYINNCSYLDADSGEVSINYMSSDPIQYGIFPLPGEKLIEKYIVSGGIFEYPFALRVNASNTDDYALLETQGFFEEFSAWLEENNDSGTFPALPTGKTAIKVEAQSNGYLIEQGESGTSIYEVPCTLIYEKLNYEKE